MTSTASRFCAGRRARSYGRNAVGGAVNLISRPPTNDLQASADFTAGNFNELRVGAQASGPLVHDRVMGSLAFARDVQRGYVQDLDHPDHPLGGDDVTAARGQLRMVFDRRTNCSCRAMSTCRPGLRWASTRPWSRSRVFRSTTRRIHDVRASVEASGRTRQSGASARLTAALTPSTTFVSLTAYRTLDYEFFVDSDTSELNVLTTHQHEWQHQLSEEITISHQQPRLSWVGGAFLFDESDHQSGPGPTS